MIKKARSGFKVSNFSLIHRLSLFWIVILGYFVSLFQTLCHSDKKIRIIVIGQGLSGLAVVGTLIQDISSHHLQDIVEINWIGDSQKLGRGMAFASWLPEIMVSNHELFNAGDYSFKNLKPDKKII